MTEDLRNDIWEAARLLHDASQNLARISQALIAIVAKADKDAALQAKEAAVSNEIPAAFVEVRQ